MSQQQDTSFPIDPFTTSGIELASRLNELNDAMISTQSGTSRPAYATQAYQWVDITTSINAVKFYTGVNDLSIIAYDTTKNKALITGGNSFSDTSKAIKLKSSITQGESPNVNDLEDGEIAINRENQKIFFKNSTGGIASIHNFPNANSSQWQGIAIADQQALRDYYNDQTITVLGANMIAKSYPDGSVVGSTDSGRFIMRANGEMIATLGTFNDSTQYSTGDELDFSIQFNILLSVLLTPLGDADRIVAVGSLTTSKVTLRIQDSAATFTTSPLTMYASGRWNS